MAGRGAGEAGAWLTRRRGVECAMWLYGAGMMAWMSAVVLGAGGAGRTPLSSLGIVLAAWAAGTVPAYLLALLATRRLPRA